MKGLDEMKKEELEGLVSKLVSSRVREYNYFNYFVIDGYSILIKVYTKIPELGVGQFTIKAMLTKSHELEIMEVY